MWRKSPIWLAPPMPAIAPESAITATILRRVRMPAYRAARGESPITCASKPNRVRELRTQIPTATATARTNPSGIATEPIVVTGHVAASTSTLPCGKTSACGEVSRQYERLSKMR